MARIRSTGNYTTELRFIEVMRNHKICGWRRGIKLPGRPDFVFAKRKVAVFIDGDFWHGNPKRFRLPKSNCQYWEQKILGNKERDRKINGELRRLGWRVVRFWESSLGDEEILVAKLKRLLDQDLPLSR
jgi:DNA mismatch endonuclease (patch repair protein)